MRIIIADDEPRMGLLLSNRLEDDGHFVKAATSGKEALAELENGYELLITDLRMPDMDGVELTKRAKKLYQDLPVILMTAYAGIDTAVAAMKAGAEDYIVKPFSLDEMALLVTKIDESRRLRAEVGFRRTGDLSDELIAGVSEAMRRTMALISKAAGNDSTVLLLGDTGTGKELAARAIHSASKRSKGPFIPVNCASLSEQLLESELFGHEKGAFTGAHKSKPGRFELAHGGTLFLDEIGELSQGIQAKLLRAIQDRMIYRLGGINPIKVDIRLIAASNRDLESAAKSGDFRDDLFFRIAVFPIKMPSLEERVEDIPALVEYFLKKTSYSAGIAKSALERLVDSKWRGNIRELFNVLERAEILAEGEMIEAKHLSCNLDIPPSPRTLDQIEREALLEAIRKSDGNKSKAAKLLGITRRMIYSRMKTLGLSEEEI